MNIQLSHATEGLPRRPFTVEDIRRMIDAGVIGTDERFELIEGDLVMMAAKGIAHERIKLALSRAIHRVLPDHLELGIDTTLRLSNTLMLEPDLSVFPRAALKASVSGFIELDPGQVLFVIEVAHSSLSYDRGLKARLYARHGVHEFWVIDANAQITWVYTKPSEDSWGSIVERGASETLTTAALPGLAVRLADID